jgi:hypothetical protein
MPTTTSLPPAADDQDAAIFTDEDVHDTPPPSYASLFPETSEEENYQYDQDNEEYGYDEAEDQGEYEEYDEYEYNEEEGVDEEGEEEDEEEEDEADEEIVELPRHPRRARRSHRHRSHQGPRDFSCHINIITHGSDGGTFNTIYPGRDRNSSRRQGHYDSDDGSGNVIYNCGNCSINILHDNGQLIVSSDGDQQAATTSYGRNGSQWSDFEGRVDDRSIAGQYGDMSGSQPSSSRAAGAMQLYAAPTQGVQAQVSGWLDFG